ncbi:MAG: tRNA pseudouridine(38-40) synthase TruA [Balneolaceae bacterium]|nr:MAG: tRNA pseudouridine(38-40) synthase TruA [Balneolaceae bacterium]
MRYKFTFEYDGTQFSGWQKQPDVRTVEGEVEKAFSTLYQQDVDLIGQGRTDAGVHAREQVAHTDLPDRYTPSKIMHAMKGLLPEDVALLSAEIVADDFHARFDAFSRSYRYYMINRPSPLIRHKAWQVAGNFDEALLQQCAELVLGEHDFVNFCIPSGDEYQTTICTITQSCWKQEGDLLVYEITGNRFLRHLVRRLVGTMIKVSSGELKIEDFKQLLHGEKATQKGHTAPAHGLFLAGVEY